MRNEEIDKSSQSQLKNGSSSAKSTCIPRGDKTETQRVKYEKIFRRIGRFKKYTHDLCGLISGHSVKVAGLRDKNDELAKCLDDFTKMEEFSTTSKLSMAVAAELVATVGDHQDLGVQRTETLVLPNLASYSRICDCIKADLWNAIQAIKREKRKRKGVAQLRGKGGSGADLKNKSLLNDAVRELERAGAETQRFCELCEEQVVKFEHKRLMDLKESLGNWIKIQIATHAKSLELWSDTYKHVQNIDEDGDLEILKVCLKIGGKGDAGEGLGKKGLRVKAKAAGAGNVPRKEVSKKSVPEVEGSPSEEERPSGSEDNSDAELERSEMISHLEKKLHHHHQPPPPQKDKQFSRSHHHPKNYENLTCRQSQSKRPSTPQRPITVPQRKNGGSRDNLSFKRGSSSTHASPPAPATDAYYYSQSDEDDRRRSSRRMASPSTEVPLTPKKHVTFYKDKQQQQSSGISSPCPTAYQSRYKYNSSYATYASGGDNPTPIKNYFQPGGHTVKKYC